MYFAVFGIAVATAIPEMQYLSHGCFFNFPGID